MSYLARPRMAHRRLLLALTVGLIARCVAGGGIGLEESRAADLEPGGDAHARVPMSTPACVACERVAREIADAAARMDGEDETLSEAENARPARADAGADFTDGARPPSTPRWTPCARRSRDRGW